MATRLTNGDLLDHLSKAGYKATIEEIEELARNATDGLHKTDRVTGGYFKVLLAAAQSALPRRHQGKRVDYVKTFLDTNEPMYQAVLRGVTTPDITPDDSLDADERRRRALERNRRSAFARGAKGVILNFLKAGGDLRKIEVADTSKEDLRRRTTELLPTPEPAEQLAEFIDNTTDSLKRALLRLAKISHSQASDAAADVVSRLASLMSPAKNVKDAIRHNRPVDIEGQAYMPIPDYKPEDASSQLQ